MSKQKKGAYSGRVMSEETESSASTQSQEKMNPENSASASTQTSDSGRANDADSPRQADRSQDKSSSSDARRSGAQQSSSVDRGDSKTPRGRGTGVNGSWWHRYTPLGALVVAVVALIIASIALGVTGWLTFQARKQADGVQNRLTSLSQQVGTLDDQRNKQADQLGQLSGRVARRDKQFSGVQDQLAAIKKRNQKLADEIDGSDRGWQLRRIRSLVLAANNALKLRHDPAAALNALSLADQRVAILNDPNLLDLRKQLIHEMGSLRGVSNPDRAGIALKLNDASERIADLPLADGLPKRFTKPQSGRDAEATDARANQKTPDGQAGDDTWLGNVLSAGKRARDSVGHAVSGLVTVRHSNKAPPQLMPPDRAAYLAQNVVLDLKNAQAAILQSHPKLYKASLASASKRLRQYFDTDDTRVAGLLDELGELRSVHVRQDIPDISASLTTINELIGSSASSRDVSGERSSGSAPAADTAKGQ